MNKVVVFIALFAQASSTLLRQSPRKLFSAMKHQMKVFGKTMWEFTTHLLQASFMTRLAKEEYVSQVTVSHHLDRRFLSKQCFQTSTTAEFFFPSYMLLSSTLWPLTWILAPCRSYYRNDYILGGMAQTLHHRACKGRHGMFCVVVKADLPLQEKAGIRESYKVWHSPTA